MGWQSVKRDTVSRKNKQRARRKTKRKRRRRRNKRGVVSPCVQAGAAH